MVLHTKVKHEDASAHTEELGCAAMLVSEYQISWQPLNFLPFFCVCAWG